MRGRIENFASRCGVLGGGLLAAAILMVGPVGAAAADTTEACRYSIFMTDPTSVLSSSTAV